MIMTTTLVENKDNKRAGLRPQSLKFAMYFFMVTVLMLFAGFTSAYIVRRAEGDWLHFEMPDIFLLSTGIIAISSVFMQWAYFSAKKDDLFKLKLFLWLTLISGLAFLSIQYYGWSTLYALGIYLAGNPAGSFLYIITGMHALHVVGSLTFVITILIATYRYKIHSRNMLKITLCTIFWHFLGGLWIYLYIFLSVFR